MRPSALPIWARRGSHFRPRSIEAYARHVTRGSVSAMRCPEMDVLRGYPDRFPALAGPGQLPALLVDAWGR
jgi:hypothetical protein